MRRVLERREIFESVFPTTTTHGFRWAQARADRGPLLLAILLQVAVKGVPVNASPKPKRNEPHDLVTFMRRCGEEIASEYARIFEKTKADPGTAGDQGEQNWAHLLREWLPSYYEVVTKGRILTRTGEMTPQVDVLVLKPSYPKKLLSNKYYLSSGIVAAFECKNNLTKSKLEKTLANSAAIARALKQENEANYYLRKHAKRDVAYISLHSPICYGLLAHTHKLGRAAREKISEIVEAAHRAASHPREIIDVICVADLGVWRAQRNPYTQQFIQKPDAYGNRFTPVMLPNPCSCYTCHHADVWQKESTNHASTTPIGSLITTLFMKLAHKDEELGEWASYFAEANAMGIGGGIWKVWDVPLSPEVLQKYDLSNPYSSKFGLDTFP